MQIPIENIYYLLCYAWNRLDEKDRVKVAVDESNDLLDLFARLLINGTRILLKRGIEKSYVEETLEFAGVKGKLELSATIKSGLHHKQRTICTIDDFSGNILINRILLSTILRLIKTEGVDGSLRKDLKSLVWMLPGIDPVNLSPSVFAKVRLHRNNRSYSFLMHVCRIIFDNTLPTEKPGVWEFIDFTRDQRQMNKLFESFLLNFYRREFPRWSVRSEQLTWQLEAPDPSDLDYLPRMVTDISITTPDGRIIIDAKYYTSTLSLHWGKEKIISGNLYQIFSYLVNQQSDDPASLFTRGILIYPTTSVELNLKFLYRSHPVEVSTVNLNQHWKEIENRLKIIVAAS